ncbi:MAG: FixH family protein [Ktedonobacterales bacterium]
MNSVTIPFFFLAIFTCLAVLSTTFWIGGMIWETWVLPPDPSTMDPDLDAAESAAVRRFRHLAPYALGLILVADVGLALAEPALMVGGWIVAPSPPTWMSTIILDSRLAPLWYIRQIIVVSALVVTLITTANATSAATTSGGETSTAIRTPLDTQAPISNWGRMLTRQFLDLYQLPRKLATGFLRRDKYSRMLCLLGFLLLLTFVLPMDAGAFSWQSSYTVVADWLFSVSVAVSLGGLLYVGYVFLPVTSTMRPRSRARILAQGLPEFTRIVAAGGILMIVAGLLSATIQPIPWTELLTTTYGRTLAVTSELWVILLAVSAYRALILGPRLVDTLNAQELPLIHQSTGEQMHNHTLVGAATQLHSGNATGNATDNANGDKPTEIPAGGQPEQPELAPPARDLEERLRDWLRREALLGGALLLALVLLGIFAISLLPNLTVATSGGRSNGPYVGTETARNYSVTMNVSPDIFGNNTFTVTLKSATGQPVSGANVLVETSSLDMDMGTQTVHLKEIGKEAPGSYSGQSELTMAGHWQASVTLQLPGSRSPLTVDFQFSASY